jgi:uncharacterized protein (DUF1800 family)
MNPRDDSLFRDPRRAWEPFEPGPGAGWDAARVAHLHRRAGLGATWSQVRRDVADGYEPSLRRVLDGEAHGPSGLPASEFEDNVAAMEASAERRPSLERAQMLWLYRLIFTPRPLEEVMTLAWHGHYATSQAKVNSPELMLKQNQVFRRHWCDRISRLHAAMLDDGAMLRWLDGLNSTREKPNENLAREFLELFALGEGNYTEQDVRETARALTGMREQDFQTKRDGLDAADHDDGEKTILGQTGRWGRGDVVRLAAAHPAAAANIARRLFRTFIADDEPPTPELLGPLAEVMRIEQDVDVRRGIEFILRSRIFHAPECRGKRVKSPVAFAIGAIRGIEAFSPPPDLVDLEIHLTKMGERLFFPPNVGGWPGGLFWLSSAAILARERFSAWLVDPSSGDSKEHIRALADRHGLRSPGAWTEAMETLFSGLPLSPDGREAIVANGRARRRDGPDRAWIVRQLLSRPEGSIG